MSRHRLDHPTRQGVYAEYGHDALLGFFAEVFREGRDKPLAALDLFSLGRPVTLDDCFTFVIERGFFTRDQLEAALVYLQDGSPRPSDLRVVGIVSEFKRTCD